MENIKFIYEKIKTFFITIINPPEAGNKKNINDNVVLKIVIPDDSLEKPLLGN
jgi:hypothetical protein